MSPSIVTMHGRDHLPWGADPIPGLFSSGTGVGSFNSYVLSISDLIGYWRLGEGAAPFADTSGFAPAADLSKVTGSVAMDENVTGALPTAQDDGAVEFIAANTQNGDRLVTGESRFEFTSSAYTVSCWVKVTANAGSFSSQIMGTWSPSNFGWYLGVAYPSQAIFHHREAVGGSPESTVTGPAVTADEWVHVAATWHPTTGHQIFYNGALVDTDPGTTTVPSDSLSFGKWSTAGPAHGSFPGSVDEAAIWSRVLTDEEIEGLWFHGVAESSSEAAGKVRAADGSGGTSWEFPTIEVDPPGGRFNKLNLGTGLSGTDEGDSVTLTADPADDTVVWMPLTTVVAGDPELVWDGDDSLIPTLTPL